MLALFAADFRRLIRASSFKLFVRQLGTRIISGARPLDASVHVEGEVLFVGKKNEKNRVFVPSVFLRTKSAHSLTSTRCLTADAIAFC